MAALPAYALSNAKWYCSQPAFSLVFERLVAAGGGNTIDTMAGPAQYRYLGYPIVISQKMPTSTGDLSDVAMILFGDLRAACIMGDRRGFRFLTSNERYMEYDQIGLLGVERFDIVVHSLGDGTTAGPIVALVGE
jgi:HK97 family phage major capsid protein